MTATLRPLPDLEGPKLGPFDHDMAADDVEFLAKVDIASGHGQILKIRIGGDKCYALKIFGGGALGTIVPSTAEYEAGPTSTMSREEFDSYFAPFESECRAFGRLKEMGCEHLAVKTYGYVVLPSSEALDKKMRPLQSKANRPEQIAAMTFFGNSRTGKPDMGIVKDWVEVVPLDQSGTDAYQRQEYDELWAVRHFPRMLKNLHGLHKLGIVVRDLGIGQYVNGVLVDLSLAATMPHPFGPGRGWKPDWAFQSCAARDLYDFQKGIIDGWHEQAGYWAGDPLAKGVPKKCSLRAYESQEGSDREMRPRPHRQRPFLPLWNLHHYAYDGREAQPYIVARVESDRIPKLGMIQPPRYDPGQFDPDKIPSLGRKKKRKEAQDGSGEGRAKRRRKGAKRAPKGQSKSAAPVEEVASDAEEAKK